MLDPTPFLQTDAPPSNQGLGKLAAKINAGGLFLACISITLLAIKPRSTSCGTLFTGPLEIVAGAVASIYIKRAYDNFRPELGQERNIKYALALNFAFSVVNVLAGGSTLTAGGTLCFHPSSHKSPSPMQNVTSLLAETLFST